MPPWVLALIFAFLALLFPFASYIFLPLLIKRMSGDDKYSELKASVTYLQTALPTIFLILTALGFGTYDAIIEKVTKKVYEKVGMETIREMTKEIKENRDSSRFALATIDSIAQGSKNKVLNISRSVFTELFPKGTIIPYSGEVSKIDIDYWAICDGRQVKCEDGSLFTTPNLVERFIIGTTNELSKISSSNFYLRKFGGSNYHKHTINLRHLKTMHNKRQKAATFIKTVLDDNKQIPAEHIHEFDLSGQTLEEENLPRYYALIFLIKYK